ncbi:MAG: hypothetical protein ACSHX6_13430 [Akkermansiaceae bacterium]
MEKIILTGLTGLLLSQAAVANFKKGTALPDTSGQSEYYVTESIPLPKGEVMEIGSIALMADKKVAVTTRRGDVWVCSGAYAKDLSGVKWNRVFNGAHEPLGMFEKDGWLHFMDRDAYVRIGDTDKNGSYETYEVISNQWGINGDYHEYNFGSTPDKDGNVYVVHCLTGSATAKSQWRGWAQKIAADGTTTQFASGVRSPGGIGYNASGDIFYTDNQGLWNGTSSLKHLKPGGFMGNPTGLVYYDDAKGGIMGERPADPVDGSTLAIEGKKIPQLVPPAVQMPHGKIGQSPTAVITDKTDGKFGLFGGQVLVGEQTHSQVQRVYLEQVNGVYQGAVWHFLGGFKSGIIPMRLSGDGTLFVGGSSRGWASAGGKPFNFERVRWTGKEPFEMEKVEALKDGFKITFTEPVANLDEIKVENVNCEAWTYQYRSKYGSPEIEQVKPNVVSVSVDTETKQSITIKLDKMTQGHVHHLSLREIKNSAGKALWHPEVYYTLNEIPK